jgi:hypothetical protein
MREPKRYAWETTGTMRCTQAYAGMQGLVEEYQRRAREYRRLVERTDDPLIAAYLIELAEVYEEEARNLALRIPQPGPESQE